MSDVTVRPTRYEVTAVPEGSHRSWSSYRITVEYRGADRWAVCHRGMCLGADGEWDAEVRVGDQTDAWLRARRFDLDTALRLAKEQAALLAEAPRETGQSCD